MSESLRSDVFIPPPTKIFYSYFVIWWYYNWTAMPIYYEVVGSNKLIYLEYISSREISQLWRNTRLPLALFLSNWWRGDENLTLLEFDFIKMMYWKLIIVLLHNHTLRCEVPCRQECQPCKKPCEIKCNHTKCNRKCGIPCAPCKVSTIILNNYIQAMNY